MNSVPPCLSCANYLHGRTCEAFKDRIPDDIWEGLIDHTAPVAGDNGVMFEDIEDAQ